MKKLLIASLVLAFAASAHAGMKVKAGSPGAALAPNIVLGWAYNPADNTSHAILTANIPGIGFGTLPCFFGGVGIGGAGLDGAFSDLAFVMSIPLATCYVKNISFQAGWEKPIAQQASPIPRVNDDLLNHTWYVGAGFAFGANPAAKSYALSGKRSAARESEVNKLLAMQREAQKTGGE